MYYSYQVKNFDKAASAINALANAQHHKDRGRDDDQPVESLYSGNGLLLEYVGELERCLSDDETFDGLEMEYKTFDGRVACFCARQWERDFLIKDVFGVGDV